MGRPEQPEPFAESFLNWHPGSAWVVDRALVARFVSGQSGCLFGVPAAEMVGRPLLDFVEEGQRGAWKDRITRVLAGETLYLRLYCKDKAFSLTQFPIRGPSGAIEYAAAAASDAGLWSSTEQELRQATLGAVHSARFEQGRISQFLHDEVGQNLSAAGLKLDLLRMDLGTLTREDAGAAVAEVQQILETVMEQVRDFSYELNPAMVERAGLHAALDRLAGRARKRFPGTLRLKASPALRVPPAVAVSLYSIAQEALRNSLRHAACSSIDIIVRAGRAGAVLEVRDNGKGFDPAEVHGGRGLGIPSMEYHAVEAGLELSILSHRGKGTVVRASAPAPAPAPKE
jgi:signal transduction histidine kinase